MKVKIKTSFVIMIEGRDLSFCRNGIYEMNDIDAKYFIAKINKYILIMKQWYMISF